jgi:MFS transporter, DHA2 family, methylenomycin A resistance protein
MTFAAFGGAIFYFAGAHPDYVVIGSGLLFMGAGAGAGIPAISNMALSAVPKSHVGVASGVFNAGGQTGILIGVAVIGSLASEISGSGLHAAVTVVALGLLTILVLCWRFLTATQELTST